MVEFSQTLSESLRFRSLFTDPRLTTSSKGQFITISVSNSLLSLALNELINQMERKRCPIEQTETKISFDGTKYNIMTIVKRS